MTVSTGGESHSSKNFEFQTQVDTFAFLQDVKPAPEMEYILMVDGVLCFSLISMMFLS